MYEHGTIGFGWLVNALAYECINTRVVFQFNIFNWNVSRECVRIWRRCEVGARRFGAFVMCRSFRRNCFCVVCVLCLCAVAYVRVHVPMHKPHSNIMLRYR